MTASANENNLPTDDVFGLAVSCSICVDDDAADEMVRAHFLRLAVRIKNGILVERLESRPAACYTFDLYAWSEKLYAGRLAKGPGFVPGIDYECGERCAVRLR